MQHYLIDWSIHFIAGITPLVEILERHIDGWPVVKGNDWQAEKFDWLEVSKQISHEGLESLIVECGVTVDLKNTSKRVMSVCFRKKKIKLWKKSQYKKFNQKSN